MNEKSDFMEMTKMMPTIGIITIVSAALTIYLCHDEYKNGKMSSKNFKIVAAIIIAQAIGGAGESIRSSLLQLRDALR